MHHLEEGKLRVISIVGPCGVGKSLLVARLTQLSAASHSSVQLLLLWFDLSAGTTLLDLTGRALASPQSGDSLADPELDEMTVATRVSVLVRILAEREVLLVLDDLEAWLEPDSGKPRNSEANRLLQCLNEGAHRSRILVTSRLEPLGFTSGVAKQQINVPLVGLPEAPFIRLLHSQGIDGHEDTMRNVWLQFEGNPRLLLFMADIVRRRYRGRLDDAIAHQPNLLTRTAQPLLQQIWNELPPTSQRGLQTLALLKQPTRGADLQGDFQVISPAESAQVEEVIWTSLVPRSLVSHIDHPSGFRVEHPLIGEFAKQQWLDMREAHRR